MMIVDNKKNKVSFEDLCDGDVFQKLDSEVIFLKIDSTDTGGKFNCVDLSHNKLYHVGSLICVERLDAKLVIE